MRGKQKRTRIFVFLMCVIIAASAVPAVADTAYAQTAVLSGSTGEMVCGRSAKLKLPQGYRRCKFSSSNSKVATVSSNGIVKAVRLGVTSIVVKSGKKQTSCRITVKPEKEGEVWLSQEAVLANQKVRLKLSSKKYDTSQVQLRVSSGFAQIDQSGYCRGIPGTGWGTLHYSYGSFQKGTMIAVYSPDGIFDQIIQNPYGSRGVCQVDAMVKQKILISSVTDANQKLKPSQLRKQGISLVLDGKKMADIVSFTPGKHELTIAAGGQKYTRSINVSYSVKDALQKKNAKGYDAASKKVFDKAFSIVNKIIKKNMTDREKVKAIHDYLIYHADYVNDGDPTGSEKWVYGAEGVLLHGEGVCQSYGIAFHMMAVSAGLDCRYISGTADGGGHAWNQVKVDGKWYYIDCTWDDPIYNGHSGGGESYKFYLSKTLWPSHVIEKSLDLSQRDKTYWVNYYLTGKGY